MYVCVYNTTHHHMKSYSKKKKKKKRRIEKKGVDKGKRWSKFWYVNTRGINGGLKGLFRGRENHVIP